LTLTSLRRSRRSWERQCQDEQAGQSFALKLTAAGVRAIVTGDRSASDVTKEGSGRRAQVTAPDSEIVKRAIAEDPAAAPILSAPRGGTKLARVLELLQRDCGATLEQLIAATDWLPHTTCVALTGLRKRGYAVTTDRSDKERGSTYHARSDETIDIERAGSQSDDPPTISATQNRRTLDAQRSRKRDKRHDVAGTALPRHRRESHSPGVVAERC
jgi:hypothetical protein